MYEFARTEVSHMNVNLNKTEPSLEENIRYLDVMEIVQLSIAPVGIIGNLTVIVVFLKDRKLRSKIPNRFIVNQVRIFTYTWLYFFEFLSSRVGVPSSGHLVQPGQDRTSEHYWIPWFPVFFLLSFFYIG